MREKNLAAQLLGKLRHKKTPYPKEFYTKISRDALQAKKDYWIKFRALKAEKPLLTKQQAHDILRDIKEQKKYDR